MSTLNVNTINAATSGQAVDVAVQNPRSFRNKVINGNMQIAQRSTSTVNHSQGSAQIQTVDRWNLWMAATGGTITMSQSTESPNGFSNSLKLQCQTVDTSIAAGDLIRLGQNIEAQDLQDLGVGTSDAKQITVSWYMKAVNPKVLTLNCYFPDATNDKWFNKNFTPTTSWARYSVTLPASTGGVINNDNGNGFSLGFTPFCGTTYSQSSDSTAWSATEKYAVSGLGNFMDSTSNILYITGVQLEVGDVATDFEHRSYGDELARCMRYFIQYDRASSADDGQTPVICNVVAGSSDDCFGAMHLPVPMRAAPTIGYSDADHFQLTRVFSSSSTVGGSISIAYNTFKPHQTMYIRTASSPDPSFSGGDTFTLRFINAAFGKLTFSSEL